METRPTESIEASLPNQTLLPPTPSLLGMPAEVRTIILRYLLCSNTYLSDLPQSWHDRLNERDLSQSKEDLSDDKDISDDQDNDDDEDMLDLECGFDSGYDDELSFDWEARKARQLFGGQLEERQTRLCGWLALLCVHERPASHKLVSNSMGPDGLANSSMHTPAGESTKQDGRAPQDPYASQKQYELHPQILTTCRLLHQDGQQLLLEHKTVRVNYIYDVCSGTLKGYVLGEASIVRALKRYPILAIIKTWSIGIYRECDDDEQAFTDIEDYDGILGCNHVIEADILALQSIQDIRSLNLEVTLLNGLSADALSHSADSFLQLCCAPFRLMRDEKCITVSSGDAEIDEEVIAIIASSTPVSNPVSFQNEVERLFSKVMRETCDQVWVDGWLEETGRYCDFHPMPFGKINDVCEILEDLTLLDLDTL